MLDVFLPSKNHDGVVSLDDFEKYIMSNPALAAMFAGIKDRVRIDSVAVEDSIDDSPAVYQVNPNRPNLFVTQKWSSLCRRGMFSFSRMAERIKL